MSPARLSNPSSSPHYESLPQLPRHQNDDDDFYQNYVVLPIFIPYRLNCRGTFLSLFTLIFISSTIYTLWPCDPDLSIVRLSVGKLDARVYPRVYLNVELDVAVRIHNTDVYSLVYDELKVFVMYRGSRIGFVKSEGGVVKPKGLSFVNATVRFDAVEVLSDLVMLVEDIAKGVIPLQTVTEVNGVLGFIFVHLPLKGKVSCEVEINTADHRIDRQNCYPQ